MPIVVCVCAEKGAENSKSRQSNEAVANILYRIYQGVTILKIFKYLY